MNRVLLLVFALVVIVAAACAPGGQRVPLWGDAPAEPLDLRAELSAREAPLMGALELRLDAFVGEGVDVEFAPSVPPDFVGSVEELEPRPWPGGEWRPYRLELRPTRVGDLVIPPFELRAGEDGPVATSPEWTVVVSSVLPDEGREVEAPAPPFAARPVVWPWIAIPLALLLAVVALVWWRRRRRRDPEQPTETPLPAHVTALRALGRLRQAPRSTAAQIETFYVDVSQIVREYLEARFGMHAPDRTTEEFLVELQADARLPVEQRSLLGEFLAQCDLVKFARQVPTESVHARTFETAEGLVEATREDRVREGVA